MPPCGGALLCNRSGRPLERTGLHCSLDRRGYFRHKRDLTERGGSHDRFDWDHQARSHLWSRRWAGREPARPAAPGRGGGAGPRRDHRRAGAAARKAVEALGGISRFVQKGQSRRPQTQHVLCQPPRPRLEHPPRRGVHRGPDLPGGRSPAGDGPGQPARSPPSCVSSAPGWRTPARA